MQWFRTLGPNGMSGARAAFERKLNGPMVPQAGVHEIGWYLLMVQSVVINFSSKVYSKSLLKGHLCRVPLFRKLYLVQKYGGRYFAKVKRIYILFQKYGGRYFAKVKRIYILFQKYGG